MSPIDRASALQLRLYTAGVIKARNTYYAETHAWQWCNTCRNYRPPFTRCGCKEKR